IYNLLVASTYPQGASKADKERLESNAKYYIWDDPYMWRPCNDQVIRRCIPDPEIQSVLHFYHLASKGGHYRSMWIAQKLLNILRKHKKAIRWMLSDLLGINPSICMHKILLEEEARPIRQQQR
ncbi:hypothetical protein CR513_08158, partial [Mucuna pruriens]